jgi:hypothetical protein
VLRAYIDESGGRAVTARSTDYFVLSAVIVDDTLVQAAKDLLAAIRADLGRRPGDTLSWKNIKSHGQRLHAVQLIGASPLSLSSVIVCKRFLPGPLPSEDHAYLYTVRFLLERLSWFARDRGTTIAYTLAMIHRFKTRKLRSYEENLKGRDDCKIEWTHIAGPGRIDQPNRLEELQLGDLVASATAPAFEADRFGNTERRYLEALAPRLYRRGWGANALTSYGLKMHPWNENCQRAHPWVATL